MWSSCGRHECGRHVVVMNVVVMWSSCGRHECGRHVAFPTLIIKCVKNRDSSDFAFSSHYEFLDVGRVHW
jgi:hypothetical protein